MWTRVFISRGHLPRAEIAGLYSDSIGFPGSSLVKNAPANAGDVGSMLESGKSPGGGNGNLIQYSCPEKSHGQRSLAGYGPRDHKESDMTERLNHDNTDQIDIYLLNISPSSRI